MEKHEPSQSLGEKELARKSEVLMREKPSQVSNISEAVVIKEGNLFFLTAADGQVPLTENHGLGLYHHDCRYLNGYELKIAGQFPLPLVNSAEYCFEADLALTNDEFISNEGITIPREALGIKWNRILSNENYALYDEIVFENFFSEEISFTVSLSFRCGFDDVFVVRGLLNEEPDKVVQIDECKKEGMRFVYQGKDNIFRHLVVKLKPEPKEFNESGANISMKLSPRESNKIFVSMILEESKDAQNNIPEGIFWPDAQKLKDMTRNSYREWFKAQANIESDNSQLNTLLNRSLDDLHLLRSHIGEHYFFSAGVPWFATLFGRDSVIVTLQTLMFNSRIATKTLRGLADYQGRQIDQWRDEEPGKILHELRVGEMARSHEIPHTPYYGSIDSTPLFLILVAEYLNWTGDLKLYEELKENIEAALHWIDIFGDTDGDGYTDYKSQSHQKRLINQGWKDSGNAIVHSDGSSPQSPIALVEVQAYVYLAKIKLAEVYRKIRENDKAQKLEKEALNLRQRFNRDFWMENKDFFVLALEKNGGKVESISSNPGHALWGEIVDPQKAVLTMKRLMSEDMDSGWGIRTLSNLEKAYNPISYHLGSIWPHDNAIIAAGFRKYGFDEAARKIYQDIFDAAIRFKHSRLPELFGGYSRQEFSEPVRYPVACHPQAWGAGTTPYMIQTMLGIQANALEKKLKITRPMLPPMTEYMVIKNLMVGTAKANICFQKKDKKVEVKVLNIEGEVDVDISY